MGGSTTRLKSCCGFDSASRTVSGGRLLSRAKKLPVTWQERMRTISIAGVLEASDNSKPCSTALTIEGRLGRGSSSQICDFIAKAWLRSCMMEEPSP